MGYIKVAKASQSSRKIPNLWFTNVTYAGTKSTAIVGGACITQCDIAWLDNIRGGKKNLGYVFLSEILCSNQELELRNARGSTSGHFKTDG